MVSLIREIERHDFTIFRHPLAAHQAVHDGIVGSLDGYPDRLIAEG